MGNKCATADLTIAKIAARQHGVVSAKQLAAAGLGRPTISKRSRDGRLHRVHHGVYAVGHPITSLHGRWMAAVLAYGDGAVLSHRSAAALWELLRPMDGPIDVSVPSNSGRRRREGIRLHRCPSLVEPIRNAYLTDGGVSDGLDTYGLVTVRHRIPVTTPARTIDDLRGAVAPKLYRRAVRQAELAGYSLGSHVERDGTRSDLERDFLALCRRAGLPKPEVNARVGRWTVDFLWRDARLAVETDSYRYHHGATAFEDDRARDLDLRRHGFEVRRFSERQLHEDVAGVIADLRAALSE